MARIPRTVLIWNMVRVIDKEIQQEKVVDDVLSILGDESNVKFIKVCRTDGSSDPQNKSDHVRGLFFVLSVFCCCFIFFIRGK